MDDSWISDVARRFESAHKSGSTPDIGEYLLGTTEPSRSKLLAELLRVDVSLRQARGDQPSLAEYVGRFPLHSRTIFEVLSEVGVAALDELSDSAEPSVPPTQGLTASTSWPQHSDPERTTLLEGRPAAVSSVMPKVDGFEVIRKIGEGGMGRVYEARSPTLNRHVALKLLPEDCAEDPERVARFRSEAEIAASIDHPNVVAVMQLLFGPELVLVMALVDGPDMGRMLLDIQRIKEGREPAQDHFFLKLGADEQTEMMLGWLDQIIDAVASINATGVLHRDIKPSNILIDSRGWARLTDFGLARLIEEALLTRTGQPMGTAGYCAPEQALGISDIDERSDQFSLAAMAFHLLTKHLPYGRPKPGAPLSPLKRPSEFNPRISPDLEAVLIRALSPDREDRYETTAKFRDQWMAARKGQPIEGPGWHPFRKLLRIARKHPWGISDAVAAALVLAVLIFPAILLRGPWAGEAGPKPLRVRLATRPPGGQAVAVPLNNKTGEPDAPNAVLLKAGRAPLMPGDYLVEVVWPDGRFHQVYRRVPEMGKPMMTGYPHFEWKYINSGEGTWAPVTAPSPGVDRGMVLLEGGDGFVLKPNKPALGDDLMRSFTHDVAPFLLDPTEVTVGAYGKAEPGRGPDEPAVMVSYDEALAYAERTGKRLPSEAEFQFAASLGGTRRFPWGDEPPEDWVFGPVGVDPRDRLPTAPPILGLMSNVAEWTTTRDDSALATGAEPWILSTQVYCGALPETVAGRPFKAGEPYEAVRMGQSRGQRLPGLGFRCARSRKPIYLAPFGY